MTGPNDQPLWRPSLIDTLPVTRFARLAEERTGRSFPDYDALHAWSVEDPAAFWDLVWDFSGVIGDKGGTLLADGDRMPGARFFPDGTLNFAENLLRRNDDGEAIVFRGEDKVETRLSWRDLNDLVSRLQQAFRDLGIGPGDRVAALMPNMPETIAATLAAASIGAVWSSASPDFGSRGALDRFGQIEPKLFIAGDGYYYAGKVIDIADKLAEIAAGLPGSPPIIVVPYLGRAEAAAAAAPERPRRSTRPSLPTPRSRSSIRACPSPTRSTSSSRRARRACRNASSIRPAARSSSTSRSTSSSRAWSRASACSTSPPAAG